MLSYLSLAMIYEFLQRLNNGNNTIPPTNYAVQHKNVSASMTTLCILKRSRYHQGNLVRCSTNQLTNVQKTLRSFTRQFVQWWFPEIWIPQTIGFPWITTIIISYTLSRMDDNLGYPHDLGNLRLSVPVRSRSFRSFQSGGSLWQILSVGWYWIVDSTV